jgi:hypothetical protein
MKKVIAIIMLVFCSILLGEININPCFTMPSELNGWEYDYYLTYDMDDDGTREIYGVYNSDTSLKLIRFDLDGNNEVFRSFDNDLRLERGEIRKINGINHFVALFGYRFGESDGNDIILKIFNLETEELVQNVMLEDNYDRNWDINYIETQSLGDSTRIMFGMECFFENSNYQVSETFSYTLILNDSIRKEHEFVPGGDKFMDYPQHSQFLTREENVYTEGGESVSYFELLKHDYDGFTDPEILLYDCTKLDIYSSQYAENPFSLYVIETFGTQELVCRTGDQSDEDWFLSVDSSYGQFFRFPIEVSINGEEGYVLYNNLTPNNVMFFEVRSIATGGVVISETCSDYYFGSFLINSSTAIFTAPGNGTPGVSFHMLNLDTLTDNDDELIQKPIYSLNNYPNPFNPKTSIQFNLPEDTNIDLSIFNVKGQKIKTLISDNYAEGTHKIEWNGSDDSGKAVSSGIYYYRLKTGSKIESRKMILLK